MIPELPKKYISNEKQEMFWSEGFYPEFYRELMISDKKKIIVSFEYACKHDLEAIRKAIKSSKSILGRWTFLFLEKPSRYVRKRLIKDLAL